MQQVGSTKRNNKTIEEVSNFVYLRSTITWDNEHITNEALTVK